MGSEKLEVLRPDVIQNASGVVLEIGFGSGLNLPFYKNVSKLYALEPSLELYSLSSERIRSAPFPIEHLQASAEEIPLSENSIDSVISTWTLCSIPDLQAALKEIYRVLTPSGTFVFIEHGKSPQKFFARMQHMLTPISKCLAGGCHLDRDIDTFIREAGFTLQKLEKFPQKSKPLAYMYKGVALTEKTQRI